MAVGSALVKPMDFDVGTLADHVPACFIATPVLKAAEKTRLPGLEALPVMLIEEPENGLTPAALKRFYRAVRALALRDDEAQRSQVLISSHSPFVVCEAWNGEDRDFIHQLKIEEGECVVRKLSDAITQQGVVLAKDDTGKRTSLGLRNAEELMSGYYA